MWLFNRNNRLIWLCVMMSMLTACSSVNQGFEALKELTKSTDESVTAEAVNNDVRGLATNQFKLTQKPITVAQQSLLSELRPLISNGNNESEKLTMKVNELERMIASNLETGTASLMLLALGNAYRSLEQPNNAVSAWQQSISRNQYNYFAHNRLAQYFRQLGEFKQAEQHYSAALEAWPDFMEGYRNRGILYDLYLGDKSKALSDYENYKQLLVLADKPTREVDRWIKEMQSAIN